MATNNETKFWGCIGLAAYVAVMVPISSVIHGWVLSKMWAWFMVPVFSLPSLKIAAAIGIASTIRLITYQADADKEDEEKSTTQRMITRSLQAICLPLFVLGFGWCVKQFM